MRKAQFFPGSPMAPPAASPFEAGGGLGALPTGGPGGPPGLDGGMPGGAPPQQGQQNNFQVIYSPLDSLGKILADLDFKTFLSNNFGTDPSQLAHKIWVMYGGNEDELGADKKGERLDNPSSSDMMEQQEQQEAEYNATRNARWKRLPRGVGIDQITSTGTLAMAITSAFDTLAKSYSKPPQPTASVLYWMKVADLADQRQQYKVADAAMRFITDRCTLT